MLTWPADAVCWQVNWRLIDTRWPHSNGWQVLVFLYLTYKTGHLGHPGVQDSCHPGENNTQAQASTCNHITDDPLAKIKSHDPAYSDNRRGPYMNMDNRRHDSLKIINVIICHSSKYDSADYHFLEPVHKVSFGQSLGTMHSFDLTCPKSLTSLMCPPSSFYRCLTLHCESFVLRMCYV